MSWFRKHRPRQIKDLHLATVRETLLGLMAEGKIPQAMLFAGPKGTGKTSASRIIAALLNDEKNAAAVEQIYFAAQNGEKGKKSSMMLVEPDPDSTLTQRICAGQSFAVQEIDAASHGLVDDVRQLKERASLLPQEGRMAVYILDEAHMMSSAAFNAFLKLLEEPPAHAVFILATTELHKIPATIASRCLLVRFQKASDSEIVTTLSSILEKEHITFTPDQLLPIVAAADGSFRDAVKLLELSVAEGKLSNEAIAQVAGQSLEKQLAELIEAVLAKNEMMVVEVMGTFRATQVDATRLYRSLFAILHEDLIVGLQADKKQPNRKPAINQFLLQQLLVANLTQQSPIPLLPLEIALLDLIARSKQKSAGSTPAAPAQGGSNNFRPSAAKKPDPVIETEDEEEDEFVSASLAEAATANQSADVANAVVVAEIDLPIAPVAEKKTKVWVDPTKLMAKWQDFLAAVSAKNPSLAALLRSSQPNPQVGEGMTIGVFYRFHQEQLQQPKFLSILEACCREVVGGDLPFSFALTTNQVQPTDSALPSGGMIEVVPTTKLTDLQPTSTQGGLAAMASEVLL